MAEGIARQMIANGEAGGLDPANAWVESAGVACFPVQPAANDAQTVMEESRDIDLSAHRSQPVTAELVANATHIFVLAQHHREAVLVLAPEAANKTILLDPEGKDVADPIGLGWAFYQETAKQIGNLLRIRLAELTPS